MTLLTFVAVVHIVFALSLIVLVLLQDSKGGAAGIVGGGGGANTVFGSTGAGNFLTQATKFIAGMFAVTCITLVYMTTSKTTSVLDNAPIEAPGAQTAPEAAPAEAPATAPVDGNEAKSPESK